MARPYAIHQKRHGPALIFLRSAIHTYKGGVWRKFFDAPKFKTGIDGRHDAVTDAVCMAARPDHITGGWVCELRLTSTQKHGRMYRRYDGTATGGCYLIDVRKEIGQTVQMLKDQTTQDYIKSPRTVR